MNTHTLSPRRIRIQQISRVFRILCRFLLVFTMLICIGIGIPVYLLSARSGSQGPGLYTGGTTAIGIITFAYWGAGLWMLDRLFSVLVSGRLFDPESGRWLKRIGFWIGTALLLPWSLRMAWDMALYGALGAIRDAPLAPIVGGFFVGAFLIMLGWVLEEGSELQAEQELTV